MVCAFGTSWINQTLDAVSDEEYARRRIMRRKDLMGSAALMLDFSREGKGTISTNGSVGRRTKVGMSEDVASWRAQRRGPIRAQKERKPDSVA